MTPPRFLSDGSAACESRSGARRLTWITRSKYSGVKSSIEARSEMAALLTRMSMPPVFSSVASMMPRVSRTSRRSPSTKKDSFPSVPARALPRSCGMPVTATRAPSRARAVAIAAPRPIELPVTTATFPASALLIAASAPVLREFFTQELRALAEVVEADLDRRALAVLDADPAVIAGPGHRAEDPVIVVEALADHPVLHELRVSVLRIEGHPAEFRDRAAVEVAVGRLHCRHARHHPIEQLVGVLAGDDRVGRIILGLEPRRIHPVENREVAAVALGEFRILPEAVLVVVLHAHHDARGLRVRLQLPEAIDDPFQCLVLLEAGPVLARQHAAVLPAQLGRHAEHLAGTLDFLFPVGGVRLGEVGRIAEHRQFETPRRGRRADLLQGRRIERVEELRIELGAVEFERRGMVDPLEHRHPAFDDRVEE